jgi:hypothetical protein
MALLFGRQHISASKVQQQGFNHGLARRYRKSS